MIDINKYADVIRPVVSRYSINSHLRICHFLAQIDHESNGLKTLVENMNYSVEALITTFSRNRITIDDCERYGRRPGRPANQEMIANIVYGGSFGSNQLGNMTFGDGWKFRGRGPLQCTGRRNYLVFGRSTGKNYLENPALLSDLATGMLFAGWYWDRNLLNALADQDNMRMVTKVINGGLNGLEHRAELLHKYKKMNMNVLLNP